MIVLSCSNISKAYIVENIIENISFTLNENEKIGLIGLNGAGKTTLFNILTGNIEPDTGTIFKAKGKKLGYLKQNTHIESTMSIINEMLTIFNDIVKMEEEIHELEQKISSIAENDDANLLESIMNAYSDLKEKFENSDGYSYKSSIRGVLRGLGFNEMDFDKPINLLSGGQKTRVMLAKLLLEKADILLLDEPTNHLDIEAISWLEKYIKDFKGTVLIISHDRYFLDNTVNRIFFMRNKVLKDYNGNYTEFINKYKIEQEQEIKNYEEYEKDIERQEEMIRRLHSYGSKRNIRQAFSRQKTLDKIKHLEKPASDNKKVKIRFAPAIKSGKDVLKVENLSKNFDNLEIFKNIQFSFFFKVIVIISQVLKDTVIGHIEYFIYNFI